MSTIGNSGASLPPPGPLCGAFYLAIVICTALYGIACMQTIFYHVYYPNDPVVLKFFVTALWALNTAHEALSVSASYKYIMGGLVNPSSILVGNTDFSLLLIFTAVIAVVSQAFFVYRIYLFSGRTYIIVPLLWALLAILQLVTATTYVAKALAITPVLSTLSDSSFMTLLTLCLSVAAGVDVLVAIFMTFLLVRELQTATSVSASTIHTLQRLIVTSLNTGIWTAVFALLSVVLLHTSPSTMNYSIFAVPVCGVYCNTVLANLNARAYISGDAIPHLIEMDLFSNSSSGPKSAVSGKRYERVKSARSARQGVWKTTEVVIFSDAS